MLSESGSVYATASPPTSGSEVQWVVSTGAPHAIASSTGSPNPSPRLGNATTGAPPREPGRAGKRRERGRIRRRCGGAEATAASTASLQPPPPPSTSAGGLSRSATAPAQPVI